jgi:hypothetical protein
LKNATGPGSHGLHLTFVFTLERPPCQDVFSCSQSPN